MACYAERTLEQSEWLGSRRSGLAEAAPTLPGTGWEHACTAASDLVDLATRRLAQALAASAEDVQGASVALAGVDEQSGEGFSDSLDALTSGLLA